MLFLTVTRPLSMPFSFSRYSILHDVLQTFPSNQLDLPTVLPFIVWEHLFEPMLTVCYQQLSIQQWEIATAGKELNNTDYWFWLQIPIRGARKSKRIISRFIRVQAFICFHQMRKGHFRTVRFRQQKERLTHIYRMELEKQHGESYTAEKMKNYWQKFDKERACAH